MALVTIDAQEDAPVSQQHSQVDRDRSERPGAASRVPERTQSHRGLFQSFVYRCAEIVGDAGSRGQFLHARVSQLAIE